MKRGIFLIVIIVVIFLISTAAAEVWFVSQPETLYSVKDELKVSLSVPATGEQLSAELDCIDKSKMIFLAYLTDRTTVDILQPLTKNFLGDMKGRCKIEVMYGLDAAESQDFGISDGVSLKIGLERQSYDPGETINIKGTAEKANTKLLDGFFELKLGKINFSTSGAVTGGKFDANITLPEDTAAGSYLIEIRAYEKDGEEIANIGGTSVSINVKQMPKKVDLALNSQNIKPGNNLNFKVMLYDQSSGVIDGEASFVVSKEDASILQSLTKINKEEVFYVEKNFSSGYYNIKAYSSGIYGERQFYVEENEEAEFSIINSTLIVKNVGNMRYDKAIQVKIGGVVEILNDEIGVGEEKKYELLAPDGEYEIFVTDGENSLSNQGVSLTGSVIAVKGIERGFFSSNKILAWLFLILVMGMFIFVSARRTLKKRFVLSEKGKIERGKEMKEGVIKFGEEQIVVAKVPREAEHSLVLKGQKQDVALVCLKIKNELSKESKINLEKALEITYQNKGAVYKSGEQIISIFSPLTTRTFKNDINAVKVASDTAKTLQEYNKKFKDKINFGISVHSGSVVNRIEENKLKFTSLGNALALAKRIAELSQGEVLLSKEIHGKTIADVKVSKIEKGGFEVFTIDRLTDTERNKTFIQDFLKRQEEDRKLKFE